MVESFTVGNDRILDLRLARYDVQGSLAHIKMLESIGLLSADELTTLTEALEKIAAELSSISNNLNQLTKYFHMGGVKSEAMQEELRRCINEVMKMREELLIFGGEYRGYVKTSRK